jgi:L-ribulose-5-phosphate 3-epimerase
MNLATPPNTATYSRREFLARAAVASALAGPGLLSSLASERPTLPIVVFSKLYQEIHLGYEDAAALTAEAGLQGIDCPVRPDGEVLPERVADDLPRYAEALRKHGLVIPLLTTAITGVDSPRAGKILRTAKGLGVQFYRLGYFQPQKDPAAQVRRAREQLKDLAMLNKEIGIGALIQNHSPSGRTTYVAGDLAEMREIVRGFDPAQVGVAFDIGHALIVHGEGWRGHFDALKPHIRVAYVKDAKRDGEWVTLGEGEVGQSGFFKRLKHVGYAAPVSLHVEYEWAGKGQPRTRAALLKALRENATVLRRWLAEA